MSGGRQADVGSASAPPLISVVICTRNRAELLRGALRGLARQTLAGDRFEVLVVDNGSTDETPAVAAEMSARLPSLRHVVEERTGLSHARNRGYREARGHWIAYTDDDCRFPPQWLAAAARHIGDHGPDLLGGPVFPFYLSPKPRWFQDEYEARHHGTEARALADGEMLVGGNLFLRRNLLESLGGFSPRLGMAGDRVAYGEEAALQWALRRRDPEAAVHYDPELFLFHLVRREKTTWRWLVRAFFGKGRDVHRSRDAGGPRPPTVALGLDLGRTAAALAWDVGVRAWLRPRRRYPHVQNYYYEHSAAYLRRLGRLWAQLRAPRADGVSALESREAD